MQVLLRCYECGLLSCGRQAVLSFYIKGVKPYESGCMFCSAMIAAAFVERDMKRIVEIGLSEIPKRSRLAEDIALAVNIAEETEDSKRQPLFF